MSDPQPSADAIGKAAREARQERELAHLAYVALAALARHEQVRSLKWIDDRLRSDMLTIEAKKADGIEPLQWAAFGTTEFCDTPSEIAEFYGETDEVLQVDGWAIVKRRFAVRSQAGVDGTETLWFDHRSDAENFLDSRNPSATPEAAQ